MKAKPKKKTERGYEDCTAAEATDVILFFPGPTERLMLPVSLAGQAGGRFCWEWNGDTEKPTLRPSIKTTNSTWVCHSFVTDGRVAFCADSTHELAGKTVDLLDTD